MSEKISLEERVARARAAQKQFEFATQEQADAACRAVLKVVFDNAVLWRRKNPTWEAEKIRLQNAAISLL